MHVHQREQQAWKEHTTEVNSRVAEISMNSIQQRPGEDEVGLNPAGQVPLFAVNRAGPILGPIWWDYCVPRIL